MKEPSQEHKVCQRYGAQPLPSNEHEKLGLAIETVGQMPVNGVRHRPENGTCGWYIWCGEKTSTDSDFYKPLCVVHLENYLPDLGKYLSLPPGYRFLLAPNHEDVWYDPEVLEG